MAGGGPSYHYKFSLPVAQLSISPALASDTRLELSSTANNQTDVYILEVRGRSPDLTVSSADSERLI